VGGIGRETGALFLPVARSLASMTKLSPGHNYLYTCQNARTPAWLGAVEKRKSTGIVGLGGHRNCRAMHTIRLGATLARGLPLVRSAARAERRPTASTL